MQTSHCFSALLLMYALKTAVKNLHFAWIQVGKVFPTALKYLRSLLLYSFLVLLNTMFQKRSTETEM